MVKWPDAEITLKIRLRKAVRPGELSPKSAEGTREGNCGANEAVQLTIIARSRSSHPCFEKGTVLRDPDLRLSDLV